MRAENFVHIDFFFLQGREKGNFVLPHSHPHCYCLKEKRKIWLSESGFDLYFCRMAGSALLINTNKSLDFKKSQTTGNLF